MRSVRLPLMVACLSALPLWACRCQEDKLDDLKPAVSVVPNPVDFLLRQVGADTTLPARVVNSGTAPLNISSITVEPAGAPFRVQLPASVTLPLRLKETTDQALSIIFHPTARGPANATLVINSDDPTHGRFEVPLVGGGGPPRIHVVPDILNFDLVNQGASQTRTLDISNTGLDTLHVTNITLDPSSNPGFRLTAMNNFGSGDILVGGHALTTVEMVPTVTGTATGLLHILSDADGVPDQTVAMQATANLGPAVKVVEKVTRQQDYRTDLYVTVTLDSSETADNEADPFTVQWRVLERPLGSQAILEPGSVTAERNIYIDQVGVYRVEVTATDTRGAVGTSIATIRAIRDLAVRLTWDAAPDAPCRTADAGPESMCGKTDLDLHLVAPGGMIGDYFTGCDLSPNCDNRCRPMVSGAVCRSRGLDCTYANRNPDWSVLASVDDDPRLDIDDAYGYGPENISMNNPVEGDYVLQVHFCNDRLMSEGAVANLEVLFHGEPASPALLGPVLMPRKGSVWLAATVHYNPAAPVASQFTLTPLGTNASPVFVDGAANLCTQ